MTLIEHYLVSKLGISSDSPLLREISNYLISEDYEPHFKLSSQVNDRFFVISADNSKNAAIYRDGDSIIIDEDIYDLNENSATYGLIKSKVSSLSYDKDIIVKIKVLVTDGLKSIFEYGFGDDNYFNNTSLNKESKLDLKTTYYFKDEFRSAGIWFVVCSRELDKKADKLIRSSKFNFNNQFEI